MAFGAIFGLRVVRWLLVLRDARCGWADWRPPGWSSGDLAASILPWYLGTMVRARRAPSSARLGPWQ